MRFIVCLVSVALLGACAPKVKPMYYWGEYEDLSYKAVKGNEDADIQKLIASFEDISNNTAKSSSGRIPPGICADFGYFLMRQGKVEEGKQWLIREKELYPESTVFIDRILKMAEQR